MHAFVLVYPIMKIRRKQRQTRVHAIKWAVLLVVAAMCIAGYWGVRGAFAMVEEWTSDLPDVTTSEALNYAQSSTILASDGTTVLAEFQLENRDPLSSLDEISDYVIKGTIDTEDIRFYEHNGYDLTGMLRALVNNFLGGSLEGASTITQQLVRNTILSDEMDDISFERKAREIELAVEMEQVYTKDEILLMYLNTINYGDGCYGIEAAAQHYFSKSADELTLAEAATLVGIPQSPSNLAPTVNPDACLERRNTVLSRMLSAGDITQDEYDAATSEPLTLNLAPDDPSDGIYLYPYFTSYVREWLLDNYSIAEVFAGGLTIYTTLDVDMQEDAEYACEQQYESMSANYEAALVAIDPETGYIKAMVGGKDYYTDQYNIAVNGRPTGSAFKAFTLVAAIEQGISPQTMADCTSPLTLDDGTEIENFFGRDYGWRTTASATAVSSNTGFVRLQEIVGTTNVIETAQRMGITSSLPAVASLTLGVASISPLEMAQAYATLATSGIYHEAVAVERIIDADGNVIYEADTTGERVLDEKAAAAATEVLEGVFASGGTASAAALSSGQPAAGKTGTSESFYDHWLIGYTPTLVCAAWLGERYNQESSSSVDCNYLWKTFMEAALEGTEITDFPTVSSPTYTYTGIIGGFGSTETPTTSNTGSSSNSDSNSNSNSPETENNGSGSTGSTTDATGSTDASTDSSSGSGGSDSSGTTGGDDGGGGSGSTSTGGDDGGG